MTINFGNAGDCGTPLVSSNLSIEPVTGQIIAK